MDLTGIISISGKPGLFKVVAQGKNNIIVESLTDKKRIPAYSSDRISALEDISIYTYKEDVPLKVVYTSIFTKENGKETISHKESLAKLEAYLEEVLPGYDRERVYSSDIKKIFQWYNLLHKADLLKVEETKEDKTADKETKKKPAAKKTTASPSKGGANATKKAAPSKKAPAKSAASKKTASKASVKK